MKSNNANTVFSIEDLGNIKSSLRYGDYKKIAKAVGVYPIHVHYVLKGERNNIDVIKAALDLIEEHKLEEEEMKQKYTKLVNKTA